MERKHRTLISVTTAILDREIPVWDVAQILDAVSRANKRYNFELDTHDTMIIVLEVGKRFGV